MYKTLYRKWRPKTFDDVVGQNHVTDILKQEVISKRISHAYLFTGSRGTGKTSCAKILAKAINCISPVNGSPCGKCEVCISIESEQSLDIVEIDAASNNKVENIRDMRDEVVFAPVNGKYRVYIVDEVHMLSMGAFNAFLKTLEEPPSHVVFILATTELNKLPSTITSRCQKFKFNRLSVQDISQRIEYICQKENLQIEEKAIELIASVSDGALRDALSILDQCFNTSQNVITEDLVKKILGVIDTEVVSEIIQKVISGKGFECLTYIDNISKQLGNMEKLCDAITSGFRDIMIFKASGCENYLPEGLTAENLKGISLSDILYCLDILQNSSVNMGVFKNQKLEMEITVLKLCTKFKNNFSNSQVVLPPKPKKEEPPILSSTKDENQTIENNVFEVLIKKAKLSNIEVIFK